MSIKIKNINHGEVLPLKNQIAYQEGQVVSKTLAQNDAVSVTLFPFQRARKSAPTSQTATPLSPALTVSERSP